MRTLEDFLLTRARSKPFYGGLLVSLVDVTLRLQLSLSSLLIDSDTDMEERTCSRQEKIFQCCEPYT